MGYEDRQLSIEEVATLLRVHPSTIVRWEQTGELMPARSGVGQAYRYYVADVVDLAQIFSMPLVGDRVRALERLRRVNLGAKVLVKQPVS